MPKLAHAHIRHPAPILLSIIKQNPLVHELIITSFSVHTFLAEGAATHNGLKHCGGQSLPGGLLIQRQHSPCGRRIAGLLGLCCRRDHTSPALQLQHRSSSANTAGTTYSCFRSHRRMGEELQVGGSKPGYRSTAVPQCSLSKARV